MKDNILIVDDNEEMVQVLRDELSENFEVISSYNGRQALEKLQNTDIQIIVCDVMMPVMDGFEFCSKIKSDVMYSHVPIILLTAKNTLQSRITGLELGADAYIEKPFEVEHLKAQIFNLIANRKKLMSFFCRSPISSVLSIAYSQSDEVFLEKLNRIIYEHMADQELDIEKISNLMMTSRTTLFRKIKSISGLTPNDLLNVIRLKKGAELLCEGNLKIFQVAYVTGFSSQTNFGRSFLKQFGMTPSEYQKGKFSLNKRK